MNRVALIALSLVLAAPIVSAAATVTESESSSGDVIVSTGRTVITGSVDSTTGSYSVVSDNQSTTSVDIRVSATVNDEEHVIERHDVRVESVPSVSGSAIPKQPAQQVRTIIDKNGDLVTETVTADSGAVSTSTHGATSKSGIQLFIASLLSWLRFW